MQNKTQYLSLCLLHLEFYTQSLVHFLQISSALVYIKLINLNVLRK
jgi:hypothetical protein